MGQLVGEAALTDARLPSEQKEPAVSGESFLEAAEQFGELNLSPDKGAACRLRDNDPRRHRSRELGCLVEDRAFQLLQLPTRIEAELVTQEPSGCAIKRECLGLAAGLVQREHQLPPRPFPERLLVDDPLESRDGLLRATERKPRVGAVRLRRATELVEAADLALGEGIEAEVGERIAAPELQRLGKQPLGGGGVAAVETTATLGGEPLEADGVELVGRGLQQIPGRRGPDALAPELSAEPRDVDLHRLGRVLRLLLRPQLLDQLFARKRLIRVRQQRAQKRPFLAPRKADRPIAVAHLQQSEHAELHHRRR